MVSGLPLGGRTLSLSRGFLAGGSIDDGSRDGDGVGWPTLELGVAARFAFELLPEDIPRSVAALYLLIFAVEMRDVK